MKAPLPPNEASRLEALRSYHVLDTAPEQAYDDVTRIASAICGVPIAIMAMIDTDRQWFKSKVGVENSETPRDQAFCAYTIHETSILEVEDATRDTRFSDNPLVLGNPNIRFYAGAPLITPEGQALGSLCVIDQHPRKLTDDQKASLSGLARLVMNNLELRRVSAKLAEAVANIKTLSGMVPICAGCKQIRDDEGFWQQVETYVAAHTEANFSHGFCPKCTKVYFPGIVMPERK
ncbi:MAG TPA: GAF domain-containing protein [Verrucomicrobiae bacterium]|nr:GAF domain-containing protein [Verrucomicrobiae bacterium]